MNDPPAAGRFPAPPAELPGRIGDGRVGPAGEPGPDPDRAPIRFDWRRNLGLFLLTVASVSFVGYTLWGSPWQFAAALMAILVAHEFGHMLAMQDASTVVTRLRERGFVKYLRDAFPGERGSAAVMHDIVGDYAYTLPAERFAEYFRAYQTGLLPDKGAEAITRYFGGRMYLGGMP